MCAGEGGRDGGPTVKGIEVTTLGWSGGLKDWLMSGRAEEKSSDQQVVTKFLH